MMEWDDIGIKDEDDVIACLAAGASAKELHECHGERIIGLLVSALDKTYRAGGGEESTMKAVKGFKRQWNRGQGSRVESVPVDRDAEGNVVCEKATESRGWRIHPGVAHIMQFFKSSHLPVDLQWVANPCGELAEQMVGHLSPNPELTAGLHKLLEAKDCFVRAKLVTKERAASSPCDHRAKFPLATIDACRRSFCYACGARFQSRDGSNWQEIDGPPIDLEAHFRGLPT